MTQLWLLNPLYFYWQITASVGIERLGFDSSFMYFSLYLWCFWCSCASFSYVFNTLKVENKWWIADNLEMHLCLNLDHCTNQSVPTTQLWMACSTMPWSISKNPQILTKIIVASMHLSCDKKKKKPVFLQVGLNFLVYIGFILFFMS